jgi:aspartyl-tRNA(Asn)/glutamyl-tRNA(Gln) amidotransferase subunit C
VPRISRVEVQHVADLARLSLSEAEADAMASELDAILEYAEQVRAVETRGVPPSAHPLSLPTPLREDRAAPPLDPELVLANAPEREDTAFVVPQVLDADEV